MAIASKMIGLGTYVPERQVTNDEVMQMLIEQSRPYLSAADLQTVREKARRRLAKAGSQTRYWCREDQFGPDIAKIAAERALADAGLAAKEIDLIIYTGMSKAFVEPATGHVLRHEIGATRANVIDTQDACTSFVKSLQIADSLIKTGQYETVLIAAGERTFDWADFRCQSVADLDWKFGSLTIGDAAAAILVQKTGEPQYTEPRHHMRFFYSLADGEFRTCHIGLNYHFGERYRLNSHSANLIRSGLSLVMELLAGKLQEEEWKNFQYDFLVIHDIGKMIDELVLPFMREANACVPDTYRSFFPQYGNVASTSLPLGLDLARQEGRLQRGHKVVYICPAAGVQAAIMVFVY